MVVAREVAAAAAVAPHPAHRPPGRRWWAAPNRAVEWGALGLALVPIVVMVVQAAATGWVPLFDAAYFTVRSRDVATSHNPLLGAWSMGSREVGAWINNLGPLQLDLLAPFTKLDPYWGTAAGVAAVNAVAVVGVWLVSRRLFAAAGPLPVVGAMAATVLVVLNEGSLMLIEARQQLALVLPMWCLLWLAAAVWQGRRWALPWLAFVASAVLQTHFTYAYQAVAVVLAATTSFTLTEWRNHHSQASPLPNSGVRRRENGPTGSLPRTIGLTGLVVIVCWIQPIWDQVAGTGNMGRVLDQGGGSHRSVGFARGLRILAESGFVPPFFVPGSMGDLLRSGPRPSTVVSVAALAVWSALLIAVVVSTRRRSSSAVTAMAAIALAALAASVYAVAKIPPTEQFGIIAQNYYWAWPVGIFAATPLLGWAVRRVLDVVPMPTGRVAHGVAWLALAPIVLGVVPLLGPTNRLPETDHEWAVARDQARPLMDDFGAALDGYDFTAPVLVDLGAVRHVRYTLLTELQRRGIDFRFAPGSTDLSRFGRERCDDGTATTLITLRGGTDALRLDLPGTLLAAVPGTTDAQADRIDVLAAAVGDALRDGSIVVDDGAVAYLGGQIPVQLARVRATDGLAARGGVAKFLVDYGNFDAVEIPDALASDVRELRDLEVAEDDNRMALYLQAIPGDRPDRCGDLAPGDEFLGTT